MNHATKTHAQNSALVPFQFADQQVRVITREGEPWFVAADVCRVLDLANSRMAADRLDDDEKNTVSLTDGNRGNPNQTIISESGLYSLIIRSDKPQAKPFRKWVTSEVLPAIRRTGSYGRNAAEFTEEVLKQVADRLEPSATTIKIPIDEYTTIMKRLVELERCRSNALVDQLQFAITHYDNRILENEKVQSLEKQAKPATSGKPHPHSRLTKDEKAEIRRLWAEGLTAWQIAQQTGRGKRTITTLIREDRVTVHLS